MTVTCKKVLVAAWPTSHMGLLTSPWMVVRWIASLKMAALRYPKKNSSTLMFIPSQKFAKGEFKQTGFYNKSGLLVFQDNLVQPIKIS